jgi:hypothetical protein
VCVCVCVCACACWVLICIPTDCLNLNMRWQKVGPMVGQKRMILTITLNIIFLKVTQSLGLLSPRSSLLEWGLQSKEALFNLGIKSWNSHLKLKVRSSYSSCTGRSSENICSSHNIFHQVVHSFDSLVLYLEVRNTECLSCEEIFIYLFIYYYFFYRPINKLSILPVHLDMEPQYGQSLLF